VFNPFHVMKLMNEKLDDLRREMVRQAESEDARVGIKGMRWLLLHRRDNLPKNKPGNCSRPWTSTNRRRRRISSKRSWRRLGKRTLGKRWPTSSARGVGRPLTAALTGW
jgi:transposase